MKLKKRALNALRYVWYWWTYDDAVDNAQHQIQDCVRCHAPFYVGEGIIDDTLSTDNYHLGCASTHMLIRARLALKLERPRMVLRP